MQWCVPDLHNSQKQKTPFLYTINRLKQVKFSKRHSVCPTCSKCSRSCYCWLFVLYARLAPPPPKGPVIAEPSTRCWGVLPISLGTMCRGDRRRFHPRWHPHPQCQAAWGWCQLVGNDMELCCTTTNKIFGKPIVVVFFVFDPLSAMIRQFFFVAKKQETLLNAKNTLTSR